MFVGDGDDSTCFILRRRFDHLGLANHCHWHPALPARERMGSFNASDWVLLPSCNQNFGTVVVEAVACCCGPLRSDRTRVVVSLRSRPAVLVVERSQRAFAWLIQLALQSHRTGIFVGNWVKERFPKQPIARAVLQLYPSALSHG